MTDMIVKRIRAMSKAERFALVERTIQESGAYDLVCRAYDVFYRYYAFITVTLLSFSLELGLLDFLPLSIIALASDVLFIAFDNKRTNRIYLVDCIISGYTIPPRLKINGFMRKFAVASPILAFFILLYSMVELDVVDGWPWLTIFGIYIFALCALRLFFASMRMPSVRALSLEANADQELEKFSLEKLAKGDHKVIIYRNDVRYPEFMLVMGFFLVLTIIFICRVSPSKDNIACFVAPSFFLYLLFTSLFFVITAKRSIRIAKFAVGAIQNT